MGEVWKSSLSSAILRRILRSSVASASHLYIRFTLITSKGLSPSLWPLVAAATRRYLRRHPGYELLLDLAAEHEDDPRWHNGVWVLRYRRPPGTSRRLTFDTRWRLAVYLRVVKPAMGWAWRFFPRHPRLTRVVTTLVPQTSKNVRPA